MAVQTFPLKGIDPFSGGQFRQYIKPGIYKFTISKYNDDPSKSSGAKMHTFTFQVASGREKGKNITEYMVMPKTARDTKIGLQKIKAMLIAFGQDADREVKFDPARLVNKQLYLEIQDRLEEERTDGDRTFPARTISAISNYLTEAQAAKLLKTTRELDDDDEDDLDDDEEDEDLDDDLDDDEEDEDELEDDDEEEEPAPAPRRRAPAAKAVAPVAARNGRAASATRKRAEPEPEADEDDDFFDADDEDEPEPEPAPKRRAVAATARRR